MEWSVQSRMPREEDIRGIELSDCELHRDISVRYDGTITNRNQTLRSIFLTVKFYGESGHVLTTPIQLFELKGGEKRSFRFTPRPINNQQDIRNAKRALLGAV